MRIAQALAFAVLVAIAVIGALEVDRRLTGCGGGFVEVLLHGITRSL